MVLAIAAFLNPEAFDYTIDNLAPSDGSVFGNKKGIDSIFIDDSGLWCTRWVSGWPLTS